MSYSQNKTKAITVGTFTIIDVTIFSFFNSFLLFGELWNKT